MTVLLAYIRTPEGDAALAAALREAQARDTDAVVVNVTRPASEVDFPMSAEQGLDAIEEQFLLAGVPAEIRQLPGVPDPATAILSVLSEVRPEVAVLGLRVRRPIGELLLSSVTQRVVRDAQCPVLLVKAPSDVGPGG